MPRDRNQHQRIRLSAVRGSEKLKSDGLTLEIDSWVTAQPDGPCLSSNNNKLVETVKKIGALMTVCTHALNKGDVYIKAPGAAMTYIKMMDVGSYLNKLLANEYLRGAVLKHFTSLLRIKYQLVTISKYADMNLFVMPSRQINMVLFYRDHLFRNTTQRCHNLDISKKVS